MIVKATVKDGGIFIPIPTLTYANANSDTTYQPVKEGDVINIKVGIIEIEKQVCAKKSSITSVQHTKTSQANDSFEKGAGLFQRCGINIDGVEFQNQIRAEWQDNT